MKNKKGMTMEFIVGMIILIVALIIIILIYRNTLTQSGENIKNTQNEAFTDTDKDGVPNIRDRCADTPQGTNVNLNGCPSA